MDSLTENLTAYAVSQELRIEDIRNLSYTKLFFPAFSNYLKKKYPEKLNIINSLLNIKSHGLGIKIPDQVVIQGIKMLPQGYLEISDIEKIKSTEGNFSGISVYHNSSSQLTDTFQYRTTVNTINHFKDKKASMIPVSKKMNDIVKKTHKIVEAKELVKELSLRRSKRQIQNQLIDNIEVPLREDIVNYSLYSPAVLFEAFNSSDKFVIAIPGTQGSHAEKDHEQVYCYFNNEGIFANEISKNYKSAIVDLNASIGNGTINNCANNKNVQILSLHVNSDSDPNIYHSSSESLNPSNLASISLDPGANGLEYLESLKNLLSNLNHSTDVLLVIISPDIYIFDSTGLLFVEQKYFRMIGNEIGRIARENKIKKIIAIPGAGFESYSHILFAEACLGINEALN